jgi:glycosyltransferase involved in cell wall biosynthesis
MDTQREPDSVDRRADGALSILWLIDLQPRFGLWHGATLRWMKLSRELVRRGHHVCLSVNHHDPTETRSKREFLEDFRALGWLSSWTETHYAFSPQRGKVAHVLGHPGLTNRVLGSVQKATTLHVEREVDRLKADVVIVSERKLLFLARRLGASVPVVVDWMDSLVLYEWRQALQCLRSRDARSLFRSVKRLSQAMLQERYYGRQSGGNLVASPVDLRVLNRVTGRPSLGRLLLNGVDAAPAPAPTHRVAERLIFTGAMDVPNNHEGAIWFIDRVLPLIVAKRPDVHLVVAGRDPIPDLRRRAGRHVTITGSVPDMALEIRRSALYVAPLVSGNGFKNKVVEAIAAGTFLAGTRFATEFLPRDLSDALLVGDTPAQLAGCVLRFLHDPTEFESRLPAIQGHLVEEYRWPARAREFSEMISEAVHATRPWTARPRLPMPATSSGSLSPREASADVSSPAVLDESLNRPGSVL